MRAFVVTLESPQFSEIEEGSVYHQQCLHHANAKTAKKMCSRMCYLTLVN